VIRLREWATAHVHPLPEDGTGPVTLGTAETCAIRVRDPSRQPGQVYARLDWSFGRWALLDAGSERGISINGARCLYAELRPGVEISLGGEVTLIAESPRLILLREALERLLGWSPARRARVDEALRQIRDHDLRRSALTLCGGPKERDLIPIAQELHRLTLTEAQPFVVYDPRRRVTRSEDVAPTFSDPAAALREAKDGTLCLEHRKVSSRDLMAICLAVLPKGCRTHIVHCGDDPDDPKLPTPRIVIPPLSARKTERDRLIREYLREAAALLGGTKHIRLSPADRAWLRTFAFASLAELRTATLRIAAVRVAKDVQAASTLLGISHVALRRWLNDRGFSKLEAAGARAARRSGLRRGAGQDRRQLGRRR
jgi:hypothetical protein